MGGPPSPFQGPQITSFHVTSPLVVSAGCGGGGREAAVSPGALRTWIEGKVKRRQEERPFTSLSGAGGSDLSPK